MTDLNLHGPVDARQRRWRRLSRAISGSLGVAAIGGAVYLGATGPLVSPVQPAAAVAAVAPAPAVEDGGRVVLDGGGRSVGTRGAREADLGQGRRR